MAKDVRNAASTVHASDDVLIVSHIDADGISSAAIAYTACIRSKVRRTIDSLKTQADDSIKESELAQKLDGSLDTENMVDEHRIARLASVIASANRLLEEGCDDQDSVTDCLVRASDAVNAYAEREAQKKIRVLFAKKMDPETIRKIQDDSSSLIWI